MLSNPLVRSLYYALRPLSTTCTVLCTASVSSPVLYPRLPSRHTSRHEITRTRAAGAHTRHTRLETRPVYLYKA